MPHIVIKALKGSTKEQWDVAAQKIRAALLDMGKPDKAISVSLEEYEPAEWEGVFNAEIGGKDNLLVKPGYSNPVTFE